MYLPTSFENNRMFAELWQNIAFTHHTRFSLAVIFFTIIFLEEVQLVTYSLSSKKKKALQIGVLHTMYFVIRVVTV